MRTDLYRDPKVCAIADRLMHQHGELAQYVSQNCQRDMTVTRNVMRNVTVGALVSVWGVMRLRGKRVNDDLVFKSGTLWIIDDLSELPGFGEAMASIGWVLADEDGITFPNFFSDYNVDPNEDANSKNAERQRRYREKNKLKSNVTDDVTKASQSNAREEKRREEKKERNTKTPAIAAPDGVADSVWADFVQLRKDKKAKLTQTALDGIAAEAVKAGWSLDAALRECCARGWTGFKAHWVAEKPAISSTQQPLNKQQALEQRNRAVADQWLREQEQQDATR